MEMQGSVRESYFNYLCMTALLKVLFVKLAKTHNCNSRMILSAFKEGEEKLFDLQTEHQNLGKPFLPLLNTEL